MKTKSRIIISAITIIIALQTHAQDTLNHSTVFPSGISIGYGQGLYSVKDEYVSNEKYSGTIPYYSVEWMRFKNKNGYRLKFEYWKTTGISNNNIKAEAQQVSFNQDFIYPIGKFSLFSRNVYAYLGPSVQLFYYEIYYHFVRPGTFISPAANGIIGSLGVNTEFIYRVNKKINIEAFLRSNLFSFSSKAMDNQEQSNDLGSTLLSVFTASKSDLDLSVRYYLFNRISLSLSYKFDLSRINKWDPYIAASDNIILSFTVKLKP